MATKWFGPGLRSSMAPEVEQVVSKSGPTSAKSFYGESGKDIRLSSPGVKWDDIRKLRKDTVDNFGELFMEAFDKIYKQIVEERRTSLSRHLLPTMKTPAILKKSRKRRESSPPLTSTAPPLTDKLVTNTTPSLKDFTPRSAFRLQTQETVWFTSKTSNGNISQAYENKENMESDNIPLSVSQPQKPHSPLTVKNIGSNDSPNTTMNTANDTIISAKERGKRETTSRRVTRASIRGRAVNSSPLVGLSSPVRSMRSRGVPRKAAGRKRKSNRAVVDSSADVKEIVKTEDGGEAGNEEMKQDRGESSLQSTRSRGSARNAAGSEESSADYFSKEAQKSGDCDEAKDKEEEDKDGDDNSSLRSTKSRGTTRKAAGRKGSSRTVGRSSKGVNDSSNDVQKTVENEEMEVEVKTELKNITQSNSVTEEKSELPAPRVETTSGNIMSVPTTTVVDTSTVHASSKPPHPTAATKPRRVRGSRVPNPARSSNTTESSPSTTVTCIARVGGDCGRQTRSRSKRGAPPPSISSPLLMSTKKRFCSATTSSSPAPRVTRGQARAALAKPSLRTRNDSGYGSRESHTSVLNSTEKRISHGVSPAVNPSAIAHNDNPILDVELMDVHNSPFTAHTHSLSQTNKTVHKPSPAAKTPTLELTSIVSFPSTPPPTTNTVLIKDSPKGAHTTPRYSCSNRSTEVEGEINGQTNSNSDEPDPELDLFHTPVGSFTLTPETVFKTAIAGGGKRDEESEVGQGRGSAFEGHENGEEEETGWRGSIIGKRLRSLSLERMSMEEVKSKKMYFASIRTPSTNSESAGSNDEDTAGLPLQLRSPDGTSSQNEEAVKECYTEVIISPDSDPNNSGSSPDSDAGCSTSPVSAGTDSTPSSSSDVFIVDSSDPHSTDSQEEMVVVEEDDDEEEEMRVMEEEDEGMMVKDGFDNTALKTAKAQGISLALDRVVSDDKTSMWDKNSPSIKLNKNKKLPWPFLHNKGEGLPLPLVLNNDGKTTSFLPKPSPKIQGDGKLVLANGSTLPLSFLPKGSPQAQTKAHRKEDRKQKLLQRLQKKKEEEEQRKRNLEERRLQEVEERKRRNAEKAQRVAENRRQEEEKMKLLRKKQQESDELSKKQQRMNQMKAEERLKKSRKHNEHMAAVLARKKQEDDLKVKKLQQIEEDRRMAEELHRQRLEREEEERQERKLEKQKQEKERQFQKEVEERDRQEERERQKPEVVPGLKLKPRPALEERKNSPFAEDKKKVFHQLLASHCAVNVPTTASRLIQEWKAKVPPNPATVTKSKPPPNIPATVIKPKPTLPTTALPIASTSTVQSSPEENRDLQNIAKSGSSYSSIHAYNHTNPNPSTSHTSQHSSNSSTDDNFDHPTDRDEHSNLNSTFTKDNIVTHTQPTIPHTPINSTSSNHHGHPNTTTKANTNAQSYELTPVDPIFTNYDIHNISSGDSTDEEDRPKKPIPAWARPPQLWPIVQRQEVRVGEGKLNLCNIFPPKQLLKDVDLARIFKHKRKRFYHRSSSARWDSPIH